MSSVPYANVLAGRNPLPIIEQTPGRLAVVLARFSPQQADVPPAPGKWSLREVMAHLADCEIAWAWRLRQAYEGNHQRITPFDQDIWARVYKTTYSLAEAQACWSALRAWNVSFLRGLLPEDFDKPVMHPERGPETLRTLAEIIAGHDLHHLQLLEKLPGA